MMIERRSHQRFGAMNRALVVVSDNGLPFHIIDISLGGLAFRYIGKDQLAGAVTEISILYGDKIYLEKVPVDAISDQPLKEGHIPMRRLGLRYRDLTTEQKSRLEAFIQSHTKEGSKRPPSQKPSH